MNRFLISIAVVILATVNGILAQATEHERSDLLEKLSRVKDYHDDHVTMSPDRDLLKGFKAWGDPGIEQLRKSLRDENRDVRHHCVLLLAELPGGTDVLLETLQDKSSRDLNPVRMVILGLMGPVLRDRRFISALDSLIDSDDQDLSVQAISASGSAHYLKLASGLLRIMRSENGPRAIASAYALAEMNIPDGARLICEDARNSIELPLWQGKVVDTLRRSGSPDAVPYLLEMFEKGMEITAADEEPARMVFSDVRHLLDGPRRVDAVAALSGLGDESVLDAAIALLESDDRRSQQMGIISIANLADKSQKARDRLTKVLAEPDESLQATALSWIGAVGEHPTLEKAVLRWAKKQDDPKKILVAIRALARVGSSASMEYLRSLSESTSATVRYTAALCRGAITGKNQIFVRDSGEEVDVVLTSYYARSLQMRKTR